MSLLWSKGGNPNLKVSEFTVGRDRELDLQMSGFDIEGSIAHVNMIASIGLLPDDEEWKFSSFREYSDRPDYIFKINIQQTLEWFDGIENFKEVHLQYIFSKT